MKKIIFLFCLSISFISCNDTKKDGDAKATQEENQIKQSKKKVGTSAQDQPIDNIEADSATEPNPGRDEDPVSNGISGTYYHTQHKDDASCTCYCLEINSGGNSELCLKENELYINARFQKNGKNFDVYYLGKSSKTSNNEIPWDKFETGTPIAVLSPEGDGTLKLDWKGFSQNGEIALDYALYGKKTLEGTYKKK